MTEAHTFFRHVRQAYKYLGNYRDNSQQFRLKQIEEYVNNHFDVLYNNPYLQFLLDQLGFKVFHVTYYYWYPVLYFGLEFPTAINEFRIDGNLPTDYFTFKEFRNL